MKSLFALSLLPLSLLLGGCPCGAYDGAGDTMFRRGNDSMIVCTNGGFAATLSTGFLEGRQVQQDGNVRGSIGDTGAHAFTLTAAQDGTLGSPEFGAGWELVVLDKTDLDHASTMCTDLESRAWWPTNANALPVATAFTKPALDYPTVLACEDAQGRGEFPIDVSCVDQLVLCPNGQLQMSPASFGDYTADAGTITATSTSQQAFPTFSATYAVDGTFTAQAGGPRAEVWHRVPMTDVDPMLRCAP
jgi:hypothetical protein